MASRNGGFGDYFDIPVTEEQIAKSMLAEDVTPIVKWEKDSDGKSKQIPVLDKDGTPQWEIQTLMIPYEGDERKHVSILRVTMSSKTKPVVKVNQPIRFVDFTVRPWSNDTAEGVSYKATGFKQD